VLFSLPLVLILAIFMLAYYVLLSDVYGRVHEKFIEKEVDDRLTQLKQCPEATTNSELDDDSSVNEDHYV
jgi:hypothetical protein